MALRQRVVGNSAVPTYTPNGYYDWLCNNHGTERQSTWTGLRTGVYAEMTDVVTPGFRRKANAGQVFNNPMSSRRFTYTAAPTVWTIAYANLDVGGGHILNGGVLNCTLSNAIGALRPPVHPTVPTGHLLYNWVTQLDEDRLTALSATAALADSNGKRAQGLVILAEMQKTLDTLRNPLAAMRKLIQNAPKIIKNAKASNVQKSGQLLRETASDVSSQYLAWFYGIRTVMFDIEDVMEALDKKIVDRVTGRGKSSDEVIDVDITSHGFGSGQFKLRTTYKETLTVRSGALVELAGQASTSERLGLSLRDIPGAVWELLPWSFVVDWFLNVQETIGALEALVSNKFLAQWVVKKRTLSWERQIFDHVQNTGAPTELYTSLCADSDKVVVEMYDRVPAKLSAYFGPTFNFSLNKVPTLAAISLVTQQLTKR